MRADEIKYKDFITLENVYQAWEEFKKDKSKKSDVQVFERYLEDNISDLFQKLSTKTYKHGVYQAFRVHDPKERQIHKAPVPDRIVHHLLYKLLYELYDKTFIYDSYSCRNAKGTHKGVIRLISFTRKVSRNYAYPCFALKLDIKKFFASVNHEILISLLRKKVKDKDILSLLTEVINSFNYKVGHGIPLGNLTSQVFANIYLHELDYYIKHTVKAKYYLRYADDFVILSSSKKQLQDLVPEIGSFLADTLKLTLHPNKIILSNLYWGIDFLGYVILPHYILPRTKTKRRIFKKVCDKVRMYDDQEISFESLNQSLQSYLGYFSHSNSFNLSTSLKNQVLLLSTAAKNY